MKCPACSTEVPVEASFCPKCGARMGAGSKDADAGPTPAEKFKGSLESKQESGPDEETQLWVGGYSGKAMFGTWLLGGFISVGLIVGMVFFPPAILVLGGILALLWIVLACMLAIKKLGVSYELTTQRFIHKTGILKRVTDRLEVIDIDDVTYEQGIVQRALNVGKIRISSTDRTHPELILDGINDVKRIADVIDDIRRKERRKRGVHIESI